MLYKALSSRLIRNFTTHKVNSVTFHTSPPPLSFSPFFTSLFVFKRLSHSLPLGRTHQEWPQPHHLEWLPTIQTLRSKAGPGFRPDEKLGHRGLCGKYWSSLPEIWGSRRWLVGMQDVHWRPFGSDEHTDRPSFLWGNSSRPVAEKISSYCEQK